MIFLNKEIKSVVFMDRDLVATYKRTCDRLFINIHRNLTKQLVDYLVYYHLQEMENAFGVIIDNLLNQTYEDINDYFHDKGDFSKMVNEFEKSLEGSLPDYVYDVVIRYIDRLKREMNKLYYVIENICYFAEGKDK